MTDVLTESSYGTMHTFVLSDGREFDMSEQAIAEMLGRAVNDSIQGLRTDIASLRREVSEQLPPLANRVTVLETRDAERNEQFGHRFTTRIAIVASVCGAVIGVAGTAIVHFIFHF